MSNNDLQNKKVAILVEDGFEQEELTRPRQALEEAGAETYIVSPAKDKVKGWDHVEWVDEEVAVDKNLITSRNPDDIPAFNRTMIEKIASIEPARA